MTATLRSRLPTVGVGDVTTWLAARGWTRRANFPRRELLVFDGPPDDAGKPIVATLPSDEHAPDFRDRLADLVELVAAVDNRDVEHVLADLVATDADVIEVRLISPSTTRGSVPLDGAVQMVTALRDLLTAAACAEADPKPSYARATRVALEHVHACRFGQTRRGSFVATIECPVTPTIAQGNLPIVTPFERRVTERVFRGLALLHRTVLDGRPDPLAEGYKQGLTANMCDALRSLRGDGDGEIEFSAVWNRRVPAPNDLPSVVRVEARGFEFLDAAARAMRVPQAPVERTFEGRVVGLSDSSDGDEDEGDDVRVATLAFFEGARTVKARMQLDAEDYRCACDAHRDAKDVRVRGRLERDGRRTWIRGAVLLRPGDAPQTPQSS